MGAPKTPMYTYISYNESDFPTFCTESSSEMAAFLGLTLGSFYCALSRREKRKTDRKYRVYAFRNKELDEVTI